MLILTCVRRHPRQVTVIAGFAIAFAYGVGAIVSVLFPRSISFFPTSRSALSLAVLLLTGAGSLLLQWRMTLVVLAIVPLLGAAGYLQVGCCRSSLLQSLVLLHQPPGYARTLVEPCRLAASLRTRRKAMATAHVFNMASCVQAEFMVGFSAEADKMFAEANQTASEAFSSIRTVSNICCFFVFCL